MNIMYVINSLTLGGAERQLVELLKGLDRKSYNPYLVCFKRCDGFTNDVKQLGIPILYAERHWRFDPFVLIKLLRIIKEYRIDLIHTYLPLAGIYGALSASLTRIPICNSGIRESAKPTLYQQILLDTSFSLSDVIVANSEVGRRVFQRRHNHKLRVVYNGVDFLRFCRPTDALGKKSELNLARFDKIVSIVTRLEPVKNPLMIIKIASIVIEEEPNTAFVIIGDGTLKAEMEDVIKREVMHRNVFLLGFRNDVEEILQITDVGVLTSNREGLPNAVIEMLASGVPVVATDCEGTREVLDEGQTGFFVKVGDDYRAAQCILKLLRDETLRHSLGLKGKDVVFNKFTLAKMVKKIESIYFDLLESRKRADKSANQPFGEAQS
jgi:L-malate glycosyltransferase